MAKKFKKGAKVVPVSKSVWGNLGTSNEWSEAQRDKTQPFLYVTGTDEVDGVDVFVCAHKKDDKFGDFFTSKDLVAFNEYYLIESKSKTKMITTPKFKIGDKVTPHSKSVEGFGSLRQSSHWISAQERGQQFLYIAGIRAEHSVEGNPCYSLSSDNFRDYGDFFFESDITAYVDPVKKSKTMHELALEHLDLKAGDRVRVTMKAANNTLGWRNRWDKDMDGAVGQICTVADNLHNAMGVTLRCPDISLNFSYPAYVLELVERKPETKTMKLTKDYEAVVSKAEIKVGCQTITKEKFTDLVKLAKEVGLIS